MGAGNLITQDSVGKVRMTGSYFFGIVTVSQTTTGHWMP